MLKADYLIVGAGLAGLVFAERACNAAGKRCLIVEQRDHIGGNAHDCHDAAGVLIHAYGPHYFRTNSPRIVEYLSRFTEWHPVDYRILSWADGKYWSFPVNLRTFEQLLGRDSTPEEFEAWLGARRIPVTEPRNSEEVIVSQIGWELYEKFFKGYTMKQWKRHPRDLDASVCGRIPVRTSRDDRYLTEQFQALPREGYHVMFQRMVESCGDRLQVLLNTRYQDVLDRLEHDRLVYTGPIDEFFACRHGPLPYRSLRFERESFGARELRDREAIAGRPGFWQPAMQVNYPNSEAFTRIVEIKHATGQRCSSTTIVREFPDDYGPGKEPYYPVPAEDTRRLYLRYAALASECTRTIFIGRLATYRYYNMDQVVGMALAAFERLHPSCA